MAAKLLMGVLALAVVAALSFGAGYSLGYERADNARRAEVTAQIQEGLAGVPGLKLPKARPENKHVWHLCPMEVDAAEFGMGKDDFVFAMREEHGVRIGTHYIPLHWTTAFQKRGFRRGQFPVADAVAERLVTLPIHPRLTDEGIEHLVSSIKALCRRG